MPAVTERSEEIAGHLVAWREAPGEGTPIVWVHGVPDSGELWTPFLDAAGGIAPDLPGFGRSGKRADFPYSIEGYADFFGAFVDHLGLERIRLVVHDWGAVALAWAQRHPERVERLVIVDAVPFVDGYRWHRAARLWRTRGLGEAAMGATTGLIARLGGLPRERVKPVMRHFDHGTQRAILRLYRSAPPEALAAAGRDLGRIDCPVLVLWGERDPFIDAAFGERLARCFPNREFGKASAVGHWPWLGSDEARERILRFLAG